MDSKQEQVPKERERLSSEIPIEDRLNQVGNEIYLTLPEIKASLIDDCIDSLKGLIIFSLAYSKNPDILKYASVIEDIVDAEDTAVSSDLITLVSIMKNRARERSHGAVALKTCFVPEDQLRDLAKQIDVPDTADIKICGVELKKIDNYGVKRVIGICEPKFKYVDPRYSIVLGIKE